MQKHPELILITGNISAGKTTAVEKYCDEHPGAVPLVENLDDWNEYIVPYYKVMEQQNKFFTLKEQCVLGEFQLKTTISRLEGYEQIDWNSNNIYVIERSIQESYQVFIPNQQVYLQNVILYQTIKELTYELMRYEPKFTSIMTLSEPVDTLMQRIKNRGRECEKNISRQYIERLQSYYYQFEQKELPPIEQPKNQIFVMAGIATGKTTFLENMQNIFEETQCECLDFIGRDLLEKHIKNIAINDPDNEENPWTFICQLRFILASIKFRKNSCLQERHIIEQQKIFIEQYKNCFTTNQYNLLMKIYTFLVDKMLRDCVIMFMGTVNFEQQWFQLQQRHRQGEQLYTKEYLIELNKKYDDLFEYLQSIAKERNLQLYRITNYNNQIK